MIAPVLDMTRRAKAATAYGSEPRHDVPVPPADPGAWIETPSGLSIIDTLEVARDMRDVVIIYGAQGVGKTCAALAFVDSLIAPARAHEGPRPLWESGAWYIAAHPAIATVVPFLKGVCVAVGASVTDRAVGAAELHEAIVRSAEGRHALLIVDEAQHLAAAALEQLRAIHDATGIGVALIGSRELFARLVGGKASAEIEGLRARIGRRLNVEANTSEDAAALADAWGITSTTGRKVLAEACASEGGMRSAVKALKQAQYRAAREARANTDADLRDAWAELGGL